MAKKAEHKKTAHKKKPGTVLELEEMNIFLRIPKDAVALEVTASLLAEDGKVMMVSKKLAVSDIRDQRQAFIDNVEDGDDYDARYVLTDEGRDYLEQLKKSLEEGGDAQ